MHEPQPPRVPTKVIAVVGDGTARSSDPALSGRSPAPNLNPLPSAASGPAPSLVRGGGRAQQMHAWRARPAAAGGCPGVPSPGLTISFSGEIALIGGNGIPFRNFGEFRMNFFEF